MLYAPTLIYICHLGALVPDRRDLSFRRRVIDLDRGSTSRGVHLSSPIFSKRAHIFIGRHCSQQCQGSCNSRLAAPQPAERLTDKLSSASLLLVSTCEGLCRAWCAASCGPHAQLSVRDGVRLGSTMQLPGSTQIKDNHELQKMISVSVEHFNLRA